MKLLYAITNVTSQDIKMIEAIKQALIERQRDIEMHEPLDYGSYYNKWEEKYDDITDIINNIEKLQCIVDDEDRQQKLYSIRTDIMYHYATYGGLKRLTVKGV